MEDRLQALRQRGRSLGRERQDPVRRSQDEPGEQEADGRRSCAVASCSMEKTLEFHGVSLRCHSWRGFGTLLWRGMRRSPLRQGRESAAGRLG